jgi:hypothetical protein
MAKVTVRHSRLPRYSSILMMALGVFTWLFVNGIGGAIIFLIGLAMYWLYRRQSRVPRASSGAA